MLREAVAGWAYPEPPLSKYSPHIHIILFPFKRENVNVFFPSFRNSEDRAKHGPRCFHIIFTIKQLRLLLFTLQKVPKYAVRLVFHSLILEIGNYKLFCFAPPSEKHHQQRFQVAVAIQTTTSTKNRPKSEHYVLMIICMLTRG